MDQLFKIDIKINNENISSQLVNILTNEAPVDFETNDAIDGLSITSFNDKLNMSDVMAYLKKEPFELQKVTMFWEGALRAELLVININSDGSESRIKLNIEKQRNQYQENTIDCQLKEPILINSDSKIIYFAPASLVVYITLYQKRLT